MHKKPETGTQRLEKAMSLALHSLHNIQHSQEHVMATVQEIKDAAKAEAAEVKTRVDALVVEVQGLKDQIANGTAATPEQLDEVLVAVKEIFTPTP